MAVSVNEVARYWAETPAFDEATRNEVQALLDSHDEKELNDRFSRSLEFGTGGMRGIMGAGINRMNRYTICQATEGLAVYIENNPVPSRSGVVIGYDSRNNSLEFAKASSEVLAAHNIPVYLFKTLSPTPLVSFEVLRQNAVAGIMITASHNPPEYNGYKVYWSTGGQVIPPEDKGIIAEVRNVTDIASIPTMNFDDALSQGLVKWLTEESDEKYLEALNALALNDASLNAGVGVVYTPLHGTGGRSVPAILKKCGFTQVREIPEQAQPDGNFTTVRSPNPEDPKSLEMAMAQSAADDALILANDPDADRLGVMAKHNGEWVRLNGNQIGVLLLDYYAGSLQQQGKLPEDGTFIVSLVSSPMASKVAKSYGLNVLETLTGFKWIWAEAKRIEQDGSGSFVFGMEESHGYLTGSHSGDKDGVWAAMAFAEMTASLKLQGKTPIDRLSELYEQHGHHLDDQENFTFPGVEGMQKIQATLEKFRNSPPTTLGGKQVLQVTDLQASTSLNVTTSETHPGPNLPKSNVLIFELEGNARLIVRPSGTEPKIKYYFNLSGGSPEELQQLYQQIKDDIVS